MSSESSSLKNYQQQELTPVKMYLSDFFGQLKTYAEDHRYILSNLYSFKEMGFQSSFLGESLLVVAQSTEVKTEIGFAFLCNALRRKKVGVYLVPNLMLLSEKEQEIKKFFGSYSHIIKLSRESRPLKKELKGHESHLIIIATYEAFRSFLFQIQNWQYFRKKNPFGTVVIEEFQNIGDPNRGPKLESLVYKIQDDYKKVQLCLLSASFGKLSAEKWSERLGCKLIYKTPNQHYTFEEKIKRLEVKNKNSYKTEEEFGEALNETFQEKDELIRDVCREFTETIKYSETNKIPPMKMLFFCYSRRSAEKCSKLIKDLFDTVKNKVWCDYIHAGLTHAEQKRKFADFNQSGKLRILCCSPLLQTGIHVRNIKIIVVVDPEHYSASELAEMCGRAGNRKVQVIFFVPLKYRSFLYKSVLIMNKDPLVGKQLPGLEVRGFKLPPIVSQIRPEFMPQLVLEALYRRQLSKQDLAARLDRYELDYNLEAILQKLQSRTFIQENHGIFSLTHMGEAIVLSGLKLDIASRGYIFFKKNAVEGIEIREFSKKYLNLLGRTVAKVSFPTSRVRLAFYDPQYRRQERQKISDLMQKFDIQKPEQTIQYAQALGILEGDLHTYQRNAAWIATSMYLLCRGYIWHCATVDNPQPTRYQQIPTEDFRKARPLFRCLLGIIQRFIAPEKRWQGRPRLRPRGRYTRKSHYEALILEFLQACTTQGATIQELKEGIRNLFKERYEKVTPKPQLTFSSSSIHSILNTTLKDKVHKGYEAHSKSHRPPHRYWLNEFKPIPLTMNYCETCNFFKKRPVKVPINQKGKGYCKANNEWVGKQEPACLHYKWRQRSSIFIHDFVQVDNLVQCPRCREFGTVQIPTFRKATLCNNCGILLKQTARSRYVGKTNYPIPEHRIKKKAGFQYIFKEEKTKIIFLKPGEVLLLKRKKSGVPILVIKGGGGKRYFLDAVRKIILAGGKIDCDEEILRRSEISIKPLKIEEIKKAEVRSVNEAKLRSALEFSNEDALLEYARNTIAAKILSNIYYSFSVSNLVPPNTFPKHLLREIILKQLDCLILCFFTWNTRQDLKKIILNSTLQAYKSKLVKANFFTVFTPLLKFLMEVNEKFHSDSCLNVVKYIDKLRSLEGNAEIAAWLLLKKALPPQYQFEARQINRFAHTELYWGAKALDPYNAALNYFYDHLEDLVSEALAAAGFSKYYPGPGLIHQRHGAKRKRSFENKKNRELIFDLMDPYRPPFRFYIFRAFLNKVENLPQAESQQIPTDNFIPTYTVKEWFSRYNLTEEDFYSGLDQSHDRVYYLKPEAKPKLKNLFNLICKLKFYSQFTKALKPLKEIMIEETGRLAEHLLNHSNKVTAPNSFCALRDKTIRNPNLTYYELVAHILASNGLILSKEPEEIEVQKQIQMDPLSLEALLTQLHVINKNDLETLRTAGIENIFALANCDTMKLMRLGFNSKRAQKILNAVKDLAATLFDKSNVKEESLADLNIPKKREALSSSQFEEALLKIEGVDREIIQKLTSKGISDLNALKKTSIATFVRLEIPISTAKRILKTLRN